MYSVQSDETLIAELFDAQPEAVMWYLPVWSDNDPEKGAIIDFELRYCNKEVSRLLGVSRELLIGQRILSTQLATEEARQAFFQQFLQVWLTGERAVTSYYQKELDLYVEVVRSKIKGGIISVTRDRTKEYEKELQHRRDRDLLGSILDSSLDCIFALEAVRDEKGKIVDFTFLKVNRMLAGKLGVGEEELIGKRYLEFSPASHKYGLFDLKCQVVETGQPAQKEVYFEGLGIDGWYNISVVPLGNNGIVETFTDVSESKRIKEQLERSAQRFETVVNSSQAGMFTLVPIREERGGIVDFRFGIVNQSVAAYIGQTAEVLTGSLASIYFPAYKENGLFAIYKETYLTGTTSDFDFHYEDGYDVFFHINVLKMDDEVLVTFTDHTSLKRLQRELEIKVEELKRSNISLEEFAYAASHDLKEPIRKINYFSDRLKQRLAQQLTHEDQFAFERLESAAKRMGLLIDDLLQYSRLSSFTEQFGTVDLGERLHQVLEDLELNIQEKGAVVQAGPLPVVQGQERQLQQLLQNLLSNALKYNKPGTPPLIEIKARQVLGKEAGVNLKGGDHEKAFYLIEVADNGIGFEMENAEKIFQVFQRLHGRSEYEGTGVGLAIARKVVQNHGGYIWAVSTPGEGATFRLMLPA